MNATRRLLAPLCGLLLCTANAQQMPQDNWRYDGLEFSGPDANKPLRSIAIGSGGVYVGYGDPATSIVQFTENGVFIREFGTFGYILGIACDSNGNVYVLDREDSKVKSFTSNGTFIREWGGPGTGDGQFEVASAGDVAMLTVDSSGQVQVCDPGNSRIQVFDTNGNFLRKWGEPGALPSQFPAGTPNTIVASNSGSVYIGTRSYNPSLRVHTNNGEYRRSGDLVLSANIFYPIAVTSDGLSIAGKYEYNQSNAFVYDGSLNNLLKFPVPYSPNGMCVNLRGDFYAVGYDKKIRVYEREYSNVRNSLLPPAIPQPSVLAVAQRDGTTWLDVDYQVVDADSATATTAALAFLNGNNTLADVVPMRTFREGTASNIGQNVATNTQKRITWDMAADWSVDYAQIQVEVLAKDSRNPLGIHWITVPASGGDPAIEVSKEPITDADLLDLWYWFIATQNPGVGFANGKVTGTTGLYSGQLLASGTTTTTAGRLFAAEQLGVRPITWAERLRALGGNYGFSSIDGFSVVRDVALNTSYLKYFGNQGYGSLMPESNGATKVSAGGNHSMFLRTDGSLWAFGYNANGELGDGTLEPRYQAVQVMTGVTEVAAGGSHSLFIKSDGSLWGMGNNSSGQIGDGTQSQRVTAVHIADGVTKVAAGGSHSLFVKANGELWAMGEDSLGQLGDGTATQQHLPVLVTTNVSKIAAGGSHSLFLKNNGELWAMGNNANGQLGDGTNESRLIPVPVEANVTQVAAGSSHSLFVKNDGTLWGMGSNDYGQLGTGSTAGSVSTPFQIAEGVARVAGGVGHSLFVKSNGSLWAMGYNGDGRLGDGTTIARLLPIQVENHVGDISCGNSHSLVVIVAP